MPPQLRRIAGPKRIVGGRMPIFASIYRIDDGRILQGLSKYDRDDTDAYNHAFWRACQGHESDAEQDWFKLDWPDIS